MSLQDVYNDLSGGLWEHPDPDKCPCGGSGWLLSDLDTYHWCSYHGVGVFPPENASDPRFDSHVDSHPGLYEALKSSEDLRKVLQNPNLETLGADLQRIYACLSRVSERAELERRKKMAEARQNTLEEILNDYNPPTNYDLLPLWQDRQNVLNADVIPEDSKLYKNWHDRYKARNSVFEYDEFGHKILLGMKPEYYSDYQKSGMSHLAVYDKNGNVYYYRVPKAGESAWIKPEPKRSSPISDDSEIPF